MLTGGAGYIGTHVIRQMQAAGYDLVVLDDLSTGVADRVPEDVPLVQANVCDTEAVASALARHHVDGVIHFAAKKAVGESVERPLFYYHENVDGILSLLSAMDQVGVKRLVYSSSAAVYGEADGPLVAEDSPLVPTSPYGETKVVGEWMVRANARAAELAGAPISFVLLRYFNVAGAGSDELGDTSIANLIPLALRAVTHGERPRIFGSDYPTPDGTCIRDYIHVVDLADAHVAAVKQTEVTDLGQVGAVYNVGRGEGSSVREVMDVVSDVLGFDINPVDVERRPGDPASLVAKADLIASELGWTARYNLHDMVASAWSAWPDKGSAGSAG